DSDQKISPQTESLEDHIYQSHVNETQPESSLDEAPKPLPDDDSTTRALSMLDLTPVVDFYKIGVLYVGKDQFNETEILSNIHSLKIYQFFEQFGNFDSIKGL
ncbi:639_t:CDS:2, partial [Racocetra fulgida]